MKPSFAHFTGKTLKNLVSSDRLRPYTADRTAFYRANPPLQPVNSQPDINQPTTATQTADRQQHSARTAGFSPTAKQAQQPAPAASLPTDTQLPAGWYAAERITRERRKGNQREFFVKFTTGESSWCTAANVSQELLKHWRIRQTNNRQKRKQRNATRRTQYAPRR